MRRFILLIAGLVVTLAVAAPMAGAFTTYHLAAQRLDSDSYDNYDFETASVSSTNVEWPITLMFRNNVDVDKIKNSLAWINTGSTEYGRLDNSFGWFYDADGGRKSGSCSYGGSTTHYRLYADASHGDHNWSPSVGYYVIGSTHQDVNECGGGTTSFGYSEGAENNVVAEAQLYYAGSWLISSDNWNMNNPESPRWEGNHYWSNDGNASDFIVP